MRVPAILNKREIFGCILELRSGFTVMVRTINQSTRWQFRIESFVRAFNTGNGKILGVEQPELNQDRRLVPINVFVGQFAITESNNRDERDLDALSRWSNAGQHPVHADGMRELKNHFVHELIVANGSR